MTLAPELLAMIADVKPASDEEIERYAEISAKGGATRVLSLIARIVAGEKASAEARTFARHIKQNNWSDNDLRAHVTAIRKVLSALEERGS